MNNNNNDSNNNNELESSTWGAANPAQERANNKLIFEAYSILVRLMIFLRTASSGLEHHVFSTRVGHLLAVMGNGFFVADWWTFGQARSAKFSETAWDIRMMWYNGARRLHKLFDGFVAAMDCPFDDDYDMPLPGNPTMIALYPLFKAFIKAFAKIRVRRFVNKYIKRDPPAKRPAPTPSMMGFEWHNKHVAKRRKTELRWVSLDTSSEESG